jgi:hypothetical protein
VSQKPKLPKRPEALAPYEVIPIQDPPSPGLSLKAYSFLYGNLVALATFGCAFAIFGSASWFFKAKTPAAVTMVTAESEPQRIVVREMALFLETRPEPPRIAPPVITQESAREPASAPASSDEIEGSVYYEARDPDSPPQTWIQVSQ